MLLGQTCYVAAETSSSLACWNHHCQIDYERTDQYGQYYKILTMRKYCFRPHYTCGYSIDRTERVEENGVDFIGNADITCEATTGVAPLPDIYCESSFLRDCRCGHRPFYGMDNDDNYDWFSGKEESLRGTAIQAFCDCELSAVANLILVCVIVPVILLIVTACFLRVFGKILGNLASSSFGQCKKGDTQNGTEEIDFNEVVEKPVENVAEE